MSGKQGKIGGRSGCNRIQAFLLTVMLAFWSFGLPAAHACDVDLIVLIESETASVSAAAPWMKAAHAVASLSDALNAGIPSGNAVATWNDTTMALFEAWEEPSRGLRSEMGSMTWRIQYLLNTCEYIKAHDALQRQFRLILQCLAGLGLPARPAALVNLASRVWNLVEAAKDRDEKRFAGESFGLASAADNLGRAWNVSADSPLETVRYWSCELARVFAASMAHRGGWSDELLQAVSQLKSALIRLHGYLLSPAK